MAEVLLSPQQLGINLGKFLQLLLELAVMLDGVASQLLLSGVLEKEFVDLAHRQTLGQVVERAVLMAPVVALAIGFPTAGEALHQRGAQGVGADFELGKEEVFAFAQSEGGFGGVIYPSHSKGEDIKTAVHVNK
jgi:hypothetical protein